MKNLLVTGETFGLGSVFTRSLNEGYCHHTYFCLYFIVVSITKVRNRLIKYGADIPDDVLSDDNIFFLNNNTIHVAADKINGIK